MLENYLTILEESLQKKETILDQLLEIGGKQAELFKAETPDLERYDQYVDEKDALITELGKLDEGFETLYEQIRAQLRQEKDQYALQIRRIQEHIRSVTDKSTSIQAQEQRNKEAVDQYFSKYRRELNGKRHSTKVVRSYVTNFRAANREDASILDMKK